MVERQKKNEYISRNCYYDCAHHVWKTEYQIQSNKKVGELRVAVFSDSHTGTTFHGNGFAKRMKIIEAQPPDIIHRIIGDIAERI